MRNAHFWQLTEWGPEVEGSASQFLGLSVVLFLERTALSYCPCAGWALEGVGIGALAQIRGCIWDVICATILLSLLISLGICGSYCISRYIVYNNGSPAKLVSG